MKVVNGGRGHQSWHGEPVTHWLPNGEDVRDHIYNNNNNNISQWKVHLSHYVRNFNSIFSGMCSYIWSCARTHSPCSSNSQKCLPALPNPTCTSSAIHKPPASRTYLQTNTSGIKHNPQTHSSLKQHTNLQFHRLTNTPRTCCVDMHAGIKMLWQVSQSIHS